MYVNRKILSTADNLNFYVGASRARFFLSILCQMSDEDCMATLNELDDVTSMVKRPKKALAAALNALLVV